METSIDLNRRNIASLEVWIRPGGYNKDVLPVREVWALPDRHNLC